MGTRSDIIVERADGKWARIYCHWDGYLSHNGELLLKHYQTQAKNDALVALGSISSLGEEIGEKHDFDFQTAFVDKYRKKGVEDYYAAAYADPAYVKLRAMCNVYGRDRGESDVDPVIGDSLAEIWPEDSPTEFTYVWSRSHGESLGSWYVGDPDEGTQTLIPLKDAVEGKKPLTPKVKAFGGNFVIGQHKPVVPEQKKAD